ncbi:class I SAM-dependent methyltransferase [Echinicola jeungdonensis]|uniref:Class I SAM-dependent methyltransferase n=1 Tax=Echinicola jeungdonensis TaxID=709343 RepID=A0ABV5J4B7_9BACT|nr:class I SAM-dependent methyltransferase [Echinicola jeungdonensis]MDN3667879.1 class I SAM-dependent methyltransferase [Echinicola jeungdonensis]
MNSILLRLSKIRSRQGLYEFLNEHFQNIKRGSNVLTIGSGGEINKLLLKWSIKNRFKVTSFDIDPEREPDILGDLCSFNFYQSFDVIVCCEVLEHLHSPHLGVETMFNALVPKGKIIITTPFIFPLHDRPHDYYRFTKYGLQFLFKKFKDLNITERNSYFEAIDVLWVRILQIQSSRSNLISKIIIPLVFFLKRPLTNLLDKILKTDAMTTGYNLIAIKP